MNKLCETSPLNDQAKHPLGDSRRILKVCSRSGRVKNPLQQEPTNRPAEFEQQWRKQQNSRTGVITKNRLKFVRSVWSNFRGQLYCFEYRNLVEARSRTATFLGISTIKSDSTRRWVTGHQPSWVRQPKVGGICEPPQNGRKTGAKLLCETGIAILSYPFFAQS